jgi:FkbM family methyltransferase
MPVVAKFRVKLPDGKGLIIETSGSDLDPMARGLFWWGFESHQPETTMIFYQLAQEARTVLDVGANIGYFSLLASVANGKSHIVAFEPVPQIFEYLKGNIRVNHATNVVAVSSAVTNYDGTAVLYLNEWASSSINRCHKKPIAEIEAPAVTLDSYVSEHQIKSVDLVKIDVESTEPQVLEGMQHILKRDAPDIICEVLWEETANYLNCHLPDFGYRFYWITNNGLLEREKVAHDEQYRYLDYLITKRRM